MKKNRNRVWRILYKLHRYIGLSSAIVLLMLAITGIALNHTDEFKLDSQMIQSKVILDWYGIEASNHVRSFATQFHRISQIGQQIYFDQSILLENQDKLQGAVETNEFIVAAQSNLLIILSLQGDIIEQIPKEAIQNIGLDHIQSIVIKSNKALLSSDDGLLSWQPHSGEQVVWSKTSQLPESIKQNIQNNFRSTILPLERVLLDIHSGRFFGSIGVIIVDMVGIFLVMLVISGCAIWLKHKLRALRSSLRPSRKRH